jgi:hypothetical protein
MPTQAELCEKFYYNPDTGLLYKRLPHYPFLKRAGTYYKKGCHVGIRIDGALRFFKIARVVWVYIYGSISPHKHIDHINHDKHDNRIDNLRLVTQNVNNMNMPLRRDNKTGCVGVSKINRKTSRPWRADICLRGKRTVLGTFSTKAEAVRIRLKAETMYGFHPNHGLPCKSLSDPV